MVLGPSPGTTSTLSLWLLGLYKSSDFAGEEGGSEGGSGVELRKVFESYLGWKTCAGFGVCWLSSVPVLGSSSGGR